MSNNTFNVNVDGDKKLIDDFIGEIISSIKNTSNTNSRIFIINIFNNTIGNTENTGNIIGDTVSNVFNTHNSNEPANNVINTNRTYEEIKKDDALNWISSNLPKSGYSTDKFYKDYKNSPIGTIPITFALFNSLVASLGYNKKRINNITSWL